MATSKVRISETGESVGVEMNFDWVLNDPIAHDSSVLPCANFVSCNSVHTMRIDCSRETDFNIFESNNTARFWALEKMLLKKTKYETTTNLLI